MNHVVLIGKIVGKFKLPYKNVNAIEIDYEGSEYIVHLTESMWDQVPLNENSLIAVKGHLYQFDGMMYIYADKISILGA